MLVDPFLTYKRLWGAMFSLSSVAIHVDEYICRYLSAAPDRYTEFDRLSAAAHPGAGGLLINPMTEDKSVDTSRYSRTEIARAVMEGVAFLMKSEIDTLAKAGIQASSLTMVGGPSETFPWPQILCDILDMKLSVVNGSCAGAVGAAILAGIGAGIYSDERDAFLKLSFERKTLTPNKDLAGIYQERYEEFKRTCKQ